MINLNDISVKFTQKDREVVAVDNVSLKVDKGDIYGIVGYSGAGKSVSAADDGITDLHQLAARDHGDVARNALRTLDLLHALESVSLSDREGFAYGLAIGIDAVAPHARSLLHGA